MTIRMLLSHNYSISDEQAPPLSAEEFAAAFATASNTWQVRVIDHPHWRCEVLAVDSPQELATFLATALANYRRQKLDRELTYAVLTLGGVKTTSATSADVNALQQGDWGVDVVETEDASAFLETIGWERLISGRPETDVFQAIVQ
ncbi:protein of unknown function (DUF2656) [Rubidibacter lacunae KORDI 51-2]|uniref:DUF2656 domain-containing protein n=1 Tax=Rubidibacter lacunae KORDI 51-2 TaxID=582515 RepID=U5DM51_9CHRO|nr:DUF2656 family protein [Rubidibacter lacunae]ERN41962.1 protein of unknown function (DUF2656) [Rubidibacter lacunae KORDI 51-2]